MKVYKGTNKDMQCTPGGKVFQYEQGVTYEKPKAELCAHGFHACEAPLDVLGYYAPGKGSRYFEADLEDVSPERRDDSKVCGRKITLGAEIGIPGLVKAHIEYVKAHTTTEHTDPKQATAGDSGAATAGDSGAATAGSYGAATAGSYGAATSRGSSASGKFGLSVARGNNVRVKGGLGAVLVIVEEMSDSYEIKDWEAAVVDGKEIKSDTWYMLKDGEFVEAKDNE
jgi:hypothetical protein